MSKILTAFMSGLYAATSSMALADQKLMYATQTQPRKTPMPKGGNNIAKRAATKARNVAKRKPLRKR